MTYEVPTAVLSMIYVLLRHEVMSLGTQFPMYEELYCIYIYGQAVFDSCIHMTLKMKAL
jgi:hypothetical protein